VLPFAFSDVDTTSLSVEHFKMSLPQWDANEFRVAILSDVHMNRPRVTDLAVEAANAALAEKPDLILMPGDFLNFSDETRLKNLKQFLDVFTGAKCPVLATLGNHDYSCYRPRLLIREFAQSSVKLLRNEIVDVQGVSVVGFDDALYKLHKPQILESGRQSKSLISMLHEPDYVDEMPTHVSLQISGHSHGGQVCLPFGVPVHTPYGAWKYIDGYYPDAKTPLFVTRGVGTTGPPYRLFCRPQVAVLTLVAA